MNNRFRLETLEGSVKGCAVTDVALDEVKGAVAEAFNPLKRLDVAVVEAINNTNLMTCPQQLKTGVTAYVSGSTGD